MFKDLNVLGLIIFDYYTYMWTPPPGVSHIVVIANRKMFTNGYVDWDSILGI